MFRARTSTNILLLVLWLLILGAIALQWLNPPDLNQEMEAAHQTSLDQDTVMGAGVNSSVSFSLASLDDYQEITERPLFYATRRPPPPEPEVSTPSVEPPEPTPDAPLTLIGVMVVSDNKIALVKNDDTSKVVRLKLGDKIESWQLQTINSDSVVLNKNEETKELLLLRNKRKPTLKTTLRQELNEKRKKRRQRAANRRQQQQEQQADDAANQEEQPVEAKENDGEDGRAQQKTAELQRKSANQ